MRGFQILIPEGFRSHPSCSFTLRYGNVLNLRQFSCNVQLTYYSHKQFSSFGISELVTQLSPSFLFSPLFTRLYNFFVLV